MKFALSQLFALFLFLTSAFAAIIDIEARSDATKLTQKQAEAKLRPFNIRATSSGKCTNKKKKTCTSFSGIRTGTIKGVIALKKAAKLTSVTITGGTETGHSDTGSFTHSKGFKLDLKHTVALDRYIHNKFQRTATRSNGAKQWKAPSGNLYADEISHWDVTFKKGTV